MDVMEYMNVFGEWLSANWQPILISITAFATTIGTIIGAFMGLKKMIEPLLPNKDDMITKDQYNALLAKMTSIETYQTINAKANLENPTIDDFLKKEYADYITNTTSNATDLLDTVKTESDKLLG